MILGYILSIHVGLQRQYQRPVYPWYMSRLHGRYHGVRGHGHVRTVYTAVQGPCTCSVHDPNTAVSRPVHGGHAHGRVYGPRPRPTPA